MYWFLYDRDLRHERIKRILFIVINKDDNNVQQSCFTVSITDFEQIFASWKSNLLKFSNHEDN